MRASSSKMLFRFCSRKRGIRRERERAKLDAVHGPENSRPLFRSRSATPDTTVVMATRGGSFCKRLLLNLPDHKTHDGVSTLADTFYRRARTSDVLLSRLGEREGGITLSVQVGSPPSGNFMASGFSVSLLLVPPRFSVSPLSGGRENGRISSRGVISCRSRATIPPAVSRPAAVYNVNSFFVRVLSPRGCLVPRTRCFREFVAPFNHGCARQRTCYILREMKSSLGRLILTFDSSRVDKREEEGF